MPEVEIGRVSDFFAKPVVAAIDLKGAVRVGDAIRIKGNTTDMEITVTSMQIERTNVTEAKAGDSVGIKVSGRVRRGDIVYRVT